MAGRKPTPTHLRLVRGNPGKRPMNADEPTPARVESPEPPGHLTPGAVEAWIRLAPVIGAMGVLTVADLLAFERLCEAYSAVRSAQCAVEVLGDTVYETRNVKDGFMRRPHPEVAQLADADRRLRGYLIDFGLNPAARSKVAVIPGFGAKDPTAAKYF